ncbi:SDR family NAD(P)-dependent oxidoreductase [Catenulispora subtropica]|uniref:SDR family oxidoreductase n=1 Tax=Catenulispora subtropica TaxID=450798 RepID=A0ABN2RCI3_9ACTN
MSTVSGKAVLVTGANRGIGEAVVRELLARGAARVYAGTRRPLEHADERVVPLPLDVTDPGQIRAAAEAVESLDLLVNNAGLALLGDDLSDGAMLERHFAVNVFGTFGVTQAMLPALIASRGAVVTMLSTSSWANMPLLPGYSVSKAAAFSLTQGLRAHLAGRGVRVHAAIIGVVDTDMTAAFDVPKASPGAVAAAVLDGLERGEDEIFPDPASALIADAWRDGAFKAMEREYAALVAG